MSDLVWDRFEDGVTVFAGIAEPACIFLRVGFDGTKRPNGTVGDLDVVVLDGSSESLRIPVSQVDELIEVLQRQRDLAVATRSTVEGGAR